MKIFDALKGSERLLLTIVALLVLSLLWDSLLVGPLRQRQRILDSELGAKQQQLDLLEAQARTILAAYQADPDAPTRKRLVAVEAAFSQVKQQLRERTSHLIAPEKMAEVLETVLKKSAGLDFVSMQGLGVRPLLPADADYTETTNDDPGFHGAYLHGLQFSFDGGHRETLEYLQRLERLHWVVYWMNLDYKVSEYPHAHIIIRVYTLSLDREWIGI